MADDTHCHKHEHEHHHHDHPVLNRAVITRHEESIICAYETTLDLSLTEASARMETILEKVRDFVDAGGGVVGHIKAYLEEHGGGMFLSTTGGSVQMQRAAGKSVQIAFTAIVFACDEAALCKEVETLFAELKKSE